MSGVTELLGLPGVGKTTVLAQLQQTGTVVGAAVPQGMSLAKVRNMVYGVWHAGPGVVFGLLAGVRRPGMAGQVKLILVLCERIGRVHAGNTGMVDEGILQALWGLLWRSADEAAATRRVAGAMTRLAPLLGPVYYVHCEKRSHLARINQRAQSQTRALDFQADTRYAAARRAMARLLCIVRRNGVKLHYVNNTRMTAVVPRT